MLPKELNGVFFVWSKLFTSITPLSVDLILFIICPLGLINAEIPLLAERTKFFPSSIDLNIECEKCWYGPTELPNQPSSDMFNIKSKFSSVLLILPEYIIS